MLRKERGDLIVSASEIKACVQQGLTLVNIYGKYSTMAKVATLVMRKNIYAKYDKVCVGVVQLNGNHPSILGGGNVEGQWYACRAHRLHL